MYEIIGTALLSSLDHPGYESDVFHTKSVSTIANTNGTEVNLNFIEKNTDLFLSGLFYFLNIPKKHFNIQIFLLNLYYM